MSRFYYSVVSAPEYYVEPKTVYMYLGGEHRFLKGKEPEGIVFSRHQTMDAAVKAAQTRHPYLSVVVADNSAGLHKGNRFQASNAPAALWRDGLSPVGSGQYEVWDTTTGTWRWSPQGWGYLQSSGQQFRLRSGNPVRN